MQAAVRDRKFGVSQGFAEVLGYHRLKACVRGEKEESDRRKIDQRVREGRQRIAGHWMRQAYCLSIVITS